MRSSFGGGAAASSASPQLPIDRPPVVGIDERQERQLVPLVEIRHAGRGELQQRHPERRLLPAHRQPLGVRRKLLVVEQTDGPALRLGLPLAVGLEPARVHLRLAERLLEVQLEPGRLQRPGADERLQDQVRLVGVGPALETRTNDRSPLVRIVGDAGEACPDVRAPLRVVRGRGEQSPRRTRHVRFVKRRHREEKPVRIAADLVQRRQPVPAIERRVLDAFRVHGRCRLLEAEDERVVPALLEQQDPREPLRQAGRVDGRPVLGSHEPRIRIDVRAVDVEARQRLLDVDFERQPSRQLSRLVFECRPRLLELRLRRDLGERPPLPAHLLVETRQRRLARGIDEERCDVVQELVARRPVDRPVVPQALSGLEDLLDPDALQAGFPQSLEVPPRAGEAVGMIDADAVDHPLLHELDDLAVRELPHLRILGAHARELPDVEEASVRPGPPVEVEELRPP